MARDSVARLDGVAVHGPVQFGSSVHLLFLASAVFGGFAVERLHVFAAGAGGDPGNRVAGRARVGNADCWRGIGAGRSVLGGVRAGTVAGLACANVAARRTVRGKHSLTKWRSGGADCGDSRRRCREGSYAGSGEGASSGGDGGKAVARIW